MIEWLTGKHGTDLIRTQVGEAHVMNRGLEDGAILAGEGSGGTAALPVTMTYDGLLALAMVLETMAVSSRTTEEITSEFPRLFMKKEEINCPPSNAYRTLEVFRLNQGNIDPECADGVRLSGPDGWVHVRVSDTESLIRIIAESESQEGVDRVMTRTLAEINSTLEDDSGNRE